MLVHSGCCELLYQTSNLTVAIFDFDYVIKCFYLKVLKVEHSNLKRLSKLYKKKTGCKRFYTF